ncbi:sugar ABC transporter permease [Ktedonosporobacter rubrisoli]|uniref:Sugar ABC transporter permease n=1 Tax=Ktedonosporobacter rubrisoli TaxID=2509675 RepID=A0A4V0Z0F4_KTERU|nr:sugar ABC transporter permease [Ktedonosporobacter rubrisoli]QBD83031.1 sugar ABC transporter permease [Ktedonosporobacter rubrisoli]
MSNVVLKRESVNRQPVSISARIGGFIKKYGWSYGFILPSMLTFVVFILIPVIWAFLISLQNYDFAWDGTWVGLRNYVEAFTTQSGVFTQAILNTLYYTVFTVSANVFIALILAGLIQGRSKYVRAFFLAAYYLPAVTSVVIIAITWRWLYNSEFGLFNYFLGLVHLAPVRWLSDPNIALNSITLSTILSVPATGVVLFNAAMGSIPTELYEAAEIDGAGAIRKWWNITLPLIKPTLLYVLVIYTIASFEVFEKVFIMVPSGVGNSTQVILTQIYQNGFQQFRFGVASAQGFILFLMIASIAIIQFRFLKTDVEY